MDKIKCSHCGSANTRFILEESITDTEDGHLDETIEPTIFCEDCFKSTPFPEDLDWREY